MQPGHDHGYSCSAGLTGDHIARQAAALAAPRASAAIRAAGAGATGRVAPAGVSSGRVHQRGSVMASKAMKVPASVWIVGVLALLWTLVGVAAFVMQVAMPAEAHGAMQAEQHANLQWTASRVDVFHGFGNLGKPK